MKRDSFTIRLATEADLPYMTEVLLFAAAASGEYISLDTLEKHPDTLKYVKNFPQPRELGVVAEIQGKSVGAAWIRLFSHVDSEDGLLSPEITVGVSEKYRKAGIGAQILLELYAEAKKSGWTKLSLGVHRQNVIAKALYAQQGWKLCSTFGAYDLMVKIL